jgi:hypothetical protein
LGSSSFRRTRSGTSQTPRLTGRPSATRPESGSLREVVGHLIDAERVFSYRALRFSRGDETPLPGFDENFYVANARFDDRTLQSLIEELTLLRSANVLLFRSLAPEDLACVGVANTHPVSVRALAFILAGHLQHHFGVLRERYGIEVPALPVGGWASPPPGVETPG